MVPNLKQKAKKPCAIFLDFGLRNLFFVSVDFERNRMGKASKHTKGTLEDIFSGPHTQYHIQQQILKHLNRTTLLF